MKKIFFVVLLSVMFFQFHGSSFTSGCINLTNLSGCGRANCSFLLTCDDTIYSSKGSLYHNKTLIPYAKCWWSWESKRNNLTEVEIEKAQKPGAWLAYIMHLCQDSDCKNSTQISFDSGCTGPKELNYVAPDCPTSQSVHAYWILSGYECDNQ